MRMCFSLPPAPTHRAREREIRGRAGERERGREAGDGWNNGGGPPKGVQLRPPRRRVLLHPQLLDGHPSRPSTQEVQGVLPDHVRRRVREQGREALQLRPEGSPELAGVLASFFHGSAGGRATAPACGLGARWALHRRQVLLLQGVLLWFSGEEVRSYWRTNFPVAHGSAPLRHLSCNPPPYQGNSVKHLLFLTEIHDGAIRSPYL